jgi:hypothetical protein
VGSCVWLLLLNADNTVKYTAQVHTLSLGTRHRFMGAALATLYPNPVMWKQAASGVLSPRLVVAGTNIESIAAQFGHVSATSSISALGGWFIIFWCWYLGV